MGEQPLFRQEVLQGRVPAVIGSIRLVTPLSHRAWALVALFFAISLCAWLGLGHYTRRERVTGHLVPDAGLITVAARASGSITQLNVHEGSEVHAGDSLAVLSGEHSSATMGDTAADISKQLRQQQARLQTDLDSTQQLANVQSHDLLTQARMLQGQISQIDAQSAVARRQVDELSALLQRIEGIGGKGYISALEVQQQRGQEANAEQQVQTLTRQHYEVQQQLESVRHQLTELPLTTTTKLDDLHRQLAQATQALAQNEAERASVLRAPTDGVVTTIVVKPGQAVSAGQSLLAVMPKGARLQAQLWVPSRAIGFVRIGAPVLLHYQAFPYQKFGIQRGTVASVSRSALSPAEVTAVLGQTPPIEALYRVDVTLDSQHIEAYGHLEPLKPGFSLEADLLLERRRMIEWIFEPLYGLTQRHSRSDA